MNKKLQVFVSSTYTDLKEERQAAVEAILDAGHIPAGMELFKAGKSQMKTIRKWIDESDVYMLILGGRYGSIEEDSGLSYTELEYKYALSKNMPVFAVVLDDSFLFTKAASKGKDAIFEKDNIDKYNAFKEFVKTNIVRFADNKDQILSNIHSQLNSLINDDEYNLTGWTRDSDENIAKSQQLNINLQNEQKSLKAEIISLKSTIDSLSKENISLKSTIESFRNENFTFNNRKIINLDKSVYENIKSALQSRNFLITLNPEEYQQKTAIQDCFTIFLKNYYILEKGVLSSKFRWQTGLLYAHVCPFLKTYNLVNKINNASYGLIYQISTTGIAFYRMSITITVKN